MIRYDFSDQYLDNQPLTTDQRTVYNTPLHWHSYYEVEIVLNGSALHILNGDCYHIERGDMYFCSPDDFHRIIPDGTQGITLRSFKFDQTVMTPQILEILDECEFPIFLHLSEKQIAEFEQLFLKLEVELSRCAQKYHNHIVVILAELLIIELLHANEYCTKTDVLQPSKINQNVSVIRRAIEYINLHISESLSREDVAEYLQYTPSYFSHMFSDITGKSFSGYVMDRRISLAKSLLINTDYPILKISELSGFSSQSLFHRKFIQLIGVTPAQYRKSRKAQ